MSEAIVNEPNRVIMRGDWVSEIVHNVAWSETENIDEFNEQFDLDPKDYLGDINDTFYQGIQFTRVITRKSDGKKFGYGYWDSPGNDGMEGICEANGPDHGFENEYNDDYSEVIGGEVWIWFPVEPFGYPGFHVLTGATS